MPRSSAHRHEGCSNPFMSLWSGCSPSPGTPLHSSHPLPLTPSLLPPDTDSTPTPRSEKEGLITRSNRGLSPASVLTHIHLTGHFCPFSPLFSYACSSPIHTHPSLSPPLARSLNISLHISTIQLKHCKMNFMWCQNSLPPTPHNKPHKSLSNHLINLHSRLERVSLVGSPCLRLMGLWAKIR